MPNTRSNSLFFMAPPSRLQENSFYVEQHEPPHGGWYVTFCKDNGTRATLEITNLNLILLLESQDRNLFESLLIKSLQHIKQQEEDIRFTFDYAEHDAIGQTTKELLATYFPQYSSLKQGLVKLANGQNIEIGEFYALMGDFFGLPNESISSGSDPEMRKDIFKRAFATLEHADPAYIKNILVIGALQKQAIKLAQQNCECSDKASCDCAGKALEEVSSITNQLWNKATGGAFYLYPLFQGDYLKLAKNNVDHFADSAQAAYTAGHELALDLIREIEAESKQETCDKVKIERLIHQILAVEASAGHFLTDSFSSGHIRVPRKELYNLKTIFGIPVPAAITGLFTLVMHNDEGNRGLWVTDKLSGDVWQAFGDDSLLTSKSLRNKEKVCAAARTGMLEIIGKLKQAQGLEVQPEDFPQWGTVYQLFPEPCTNLNVNQPLFKIDEQGQLLRRKDVNDPNCRDYVNNWWVASTFLLLLPQVLRYVFSGSSHTHSSNEKTHQEDIAMDALETVCLTHGNQGSYTLISERLPPGEKPEAFRSVEHRPKPPVDKAKKNPGNQKSHNQHLDDDYSESLSIV